MMTLRKPTIVAHRGLHHDFPENSVEAMAAAFRAGINAVEWDVRLTADRVPVLLHDDTLDRTTTATGHLAAAKWQDLQQQFLKHNEKVTPSRLPLLSDAYFPIDNAEAEGLKPEQWLFVVELKERHADLTRTVLESRNNVIGRVIVQSFDDRVIADVVKLDESCDVAILCGNEDELQAGIDARWPRVNMKHTLATEAVVRQLHERGVETGVWTVNAEADIRRVIDLGVGTIITDEPILTRTLVGQMLGE